MNENLEQLVGSEATALGVVRYRRTYAEFMREVEEANIVEVLELLFMMPRSTHASFQTGRWLQAVRKVEVHSVPDEETLKEYVLHFDGGSWTIVAEGHVLNVHQVLKEA